jgi:hypothetical protein
MARTQDTDFIKMALRGYEVQLEAIQTKIAKLRKILGGKDTQKVVVVRKRHRISPEGRARIAAAQRRRWAKVKR